MATHYHKVEAKDNMNVNTDEEPLPGIPVTREKVKKIVVAEPVKKKKGLIRRLWGGLVGPDGFHRIKDYVLQDIVVPSIKSMIADSIKSSIDMAMFGERRPSPKVSEWGNRAPKTNYGDKFNAPSDTPHVRTVRVPYQVDDYAIGDRGEAAEVLAYLNDIAKTYGTVAVAEYYDMLGIVPKFTDNNYGWDSAGIGKAVITSLRSGDGYVIKFPPMQVL